MSHLHTIALTVLLGLTSLQAEEFPLYSRGYKPYLGPKYELEKFHDLKQTADVFAPVVVGESPNNESCMVALSDGELRLFFAGHHSTLFLSSANGGLTWSKPQLAFRCDLAHHYPRRTIQDQDGNLHCLYFDKETNVHHRMLAAGEKEWSDRSFVAKGRNGAIRNLEQLPSGRLVFMYHHHHRSTTPPTGACHTTGAYSDDLGKNWTQLEDTRLTSPCRAGFNGNNYGACEPTLIRRSDGTLKIWMRTQTGLQYESISKDEGLSWSTAAPGNFISSNSPAFVRRISGDRLLALWCNCLETETEVFGKMYTNRTSLSAAISHDEGKTWTGHREIFRDPARNSHQGLERGDNGTAYPSAVENKVGKIVFSTGQYDGLRCIGIFDPDWLVETEQTLDFTEGEKSLEKWHLYSFVGKKNTRVQGPVIEKIGTIPCLSFTSEERGNALVNFPSAEKGSMRLEVVLYPGADLKLSLTDHHRHPSDKTAEDDAFLSIPLSGIVRTRSKVSTVDITWDSDSFTVRCDEQNRSYRRSRKSKTPPCFLRLRYTGDESKALLRSVTTNKLR